MQDTDSSDVEISDASCLRSVFFQPMVVPRIRRGVSPPMSDFQYRFHSQLLAISGYQWHISMDIIDSQHHWAISSSAKKPLSCVRWCKRAVLMQRQCLAASSCGEIWHIKTLHFGMSQLCWALYPSILLYSLQKTSKATIISDLGGYPGISGWLGSWICMIWGHFDGSWTSFGHAIAEWTQLSTEAISRSQGLLIGRLGQPALDIPNNNKSKKACPFG